MLKVSFLRLLEKNQNQKYLWITKSYRGSLSLFQALESIVVQLTAASEAEQGTEKPFSKFSWT